MNVIRQVLVTNNGASVLSDHAWTLETVNRTSSWLWITTLARTCAARANPGPQLPLPQRRRLPHRLQKPLQPRRPQSVREHILSLFRHRCRCPPITYKYITTVHSRAGLEFRKRGLNCAPQSLQPSRTARAWRRCYLSFSLKSWFSKFWHHNMKMYMHLALTSSGPFSGQWAAGFASVPDRPLVPPPRSSWLLLHEDRHKMWHAFSFSTIDWYPMYCVVRWAFWCHPGDVFRKPEYPLSYDVLQPPLSGSFQFVRVCHLVLPGNSDDLS